ncbi:MarR family winged helix-turn-helix transcriptional regulator [Salinicola peritrichatus]|uniref:MarR family winged helix-turn-helix transcriptional regulator n=1 Tax=Salinicola peritrichatus TaxID=1267424 RepID=UPI000DA12EA5|nr:MarR family winged helix-turn-helix transcriptional regulator [Salinicola peritrichatus]
MPTAPSPDVNSADVARIYDLLAHRPGFLIRRLHQIHIALFYEECAEFGLTPVQYSVLTALREGELDQITLAGSIGIDRTTTAEVLRRLEGAGWVARRRNPQDRRRRIASLTADGGALLERMGPAAQRAHDRTIAPLNEDDRQHFLTTLLDLVDSNNGYGRAPLDFP